MIKEAIGGFCMALADSVPGVSGGTVAFIMGFYDQFIGSVHDLAFGKMEDKKKAIAYLIKLEHRAAQTSLYPAIVRRDIVRPTEEPHGGARVFQLQRGFARLDQRIEIARRCSKPRHSGCQRRARVSGLKLKLGGWRGLSQRSRRQRRRPQKPYRRKGQASRE